MSAESALWPGGMDLSGGGFLQTARGQSDFSPGVKYERLCKNCFAPIYKGSNHTANACKSRRHALSNLTEAVNIANTSMDLAASKYFKMMLGFQTISLEGV